MKKSFSCLTAVLLSIILTLSLPCAALADGDVADVTPPEESTAPEEPSTPSEPAAPEQDMSGYYAAPEETEAVVTAETVENGVLDPNELTALVEAYLDENELRHDRVRIGYYYTGTGESWYYNGDVFSYSASVYKLPMMMLFAQRVANGELEQDADIYGINLDYAETAILTYSNNDLAHALMTTFPSEVDCRKQWVPLSGLPEDYFDDEFYVQSHFSPRFVVGILKTLYESPENYPNVIECLKVASQGEYLSRTLGDKYEIAQKYGAYEQFYNIAGIVYMPNPILVSINTEWLGYAERTIGEIGAILADYTLTLDKRLDALEKEKAEEAAAAAATPEPTETPAAETPAPTPELQPEEKPAAGNLVLLAAGVIVAAAAAVLALKLHRDERRRRAAHHGRHSSK